MFSIEVDAKSGWLHVCICRHLDDTEATMRHYARELGLDARVARYRPSFKILLTCNDNGEDVIKVEG